MTVRGTGRGIHGWGRVLSLIHCSWCLHRVRKTAGIAEPATCWGAEVSARRALSGRWLSDVVPTRHREAEHQGNLSGRCSFPSDSECCAKLSESQQSFPCLLQSLCCGVVVLCLWPHPAGFWWDCACVRYGACPRWSAPPWVSWRFSLSTAMLLILHLRSVCWWIDVGGMSRRCACFCFSASSSTCLRAALAAAIQRFPCCPCCCPCCCHPFDLLPASFAVGPSSSSFAYQLCYFVPTTCRVWRHTLDGLFEPLVFIQAPVDAHLDRCLVLQADGCGRSLALGIRSPSFQSPSLLPSLSIWFAALCAADRPLRAMEVAPWREEAAGTGCTYLTNCQ